MTDGCDLVLFLFVRMTHVVLFQILCVLLLLPRSTSLVVAISILIPRYMT